MRHYEEHRVLSLRGGVFDDVAISTPHVLFMQARADDRDVTRRAWNRCPGDGQTLSNRDRFAYARDDRRRALAMTEEPSGTCPGPTLMPQA